MSWRKEKTKSGEDYVWDGVELGIAPSPLKGTANIQNANISTETGEVLASFSRVNQAQLAITGGTLTPDGATLFDALPALTLRAGAWIKVTASTVSGITATTNPTTADLDYLVVGGGGGGGGSNSPGTNNDASAGGGGAGAVVTGTTAITAGTYPIVIGLGGDGGAITPTAGEDGEDSTFGPIATAPGGGGGGSSTGASDDGRPGGSGGGGGSNTLAGTNGTGGTGTPDNNGGDGASGSGGGGGGANANGTNGGISDGGNGGNGISSSISGAAAFYGGGGGGGAGGGVSPVGGTGGDGGGGEGGNTTGASEPTPATAGTVNTGGGGGAGGSTDGLDMVGAAGGSGIAIVSYDTGSMVATGGDEIYTLGGKTIHVFTRNGALTVHSITPDGIYYVSYDSASKIKLSQYFDPTGANAITHGTTGSITFNTLTTPAQGIAKATEKYTTATQTQYRYYIMDSNSYLWVFDSLIYDTYGTEWMLPDPLNYSGLKLTGIGALSGQLLAVGIAEIYGKPTPALGGPFTPLTNSYLNEPFATHTNFAMVGNQGKLYYCDGNYVGEVFATTSLITNIANIQSTGSYTADSTVGTVTSVISGSLPYDPGGTRIPVVFFTDQYGTLPTAITENEVYYIEYNPSSKTFLVFGNITGGFTGIDMETGATGNQYFATFWPYGATAGNGGDEPLVQITPQRVNIPFNETTQCLVEVGNTVLIGGLTNLVYPWNQIDATPSDFIALPESGVKTMVNVNNIAYIFAGNKGNIYVTNGSVASLALKVPDYCAGVPGTPLTYIEPVYTWGDSDYIRGRVYFSMLDQTATKAGNTGGIWSFIPAQNIDPAQEVGMALRLENRQSYGDYDGVANLIIPSMKQSVASPQYWASWQDSYSLGTSTFGIDFTNTVPVTQYVVETDLLVTGTVLSKGTFQQLEYLLSSPLATGDSLAMFYRVNSTGSWISCGTVIEESDDKISGYFKANFQKTQRLQLRAVVTTPGTTASSFVRLIELRIR